MRRLYGFFKGKISSSSNGMSSKCVVCMVFFKGKISSLSNGMSSKCAVCMVFLGVKFQV